MLYGIKQLGKPDDEIKKYLDSYVTHNERDLEKLRQDASTLTRFINKIKYIMTVNINYPPIIVKET